MVPNQETEVVFNLQDVLHTFKRTQNQIQVQSTAYPLFAVNPQKFLENPYKAENLIIPKLSKNLQQLSN